LSDFNDVSAGGIAVRRTPAMPTSFHNALTRRSIQGAWRTMAAALPLLLAPTLISTASAATLTVGPGQQYQHIQDAINAASANDAIDVVAGTYNDEYFTVTKPLTIEAVNGMVVLTNDQNIPNGKAEAIIDANVTISGFAFTGAKVSDGNGAGIRYEAGKLIVDGCYFYNNQDGILAGANPTGTILVRYSEFAHNGLGDGYTHAIYVNEVKSFSALNNYLHDTPVGHYIKSRAETTIITHNAIMDRWTGTSSYNIDVPNGGATTIKNNIIQQGGLTQNPAMIHYGGETPTPYANSSLAISGNTFINDDPSSSAVGVLNQTSISAQIAGNSFWGLTASQVASGPNAQSGDNFLSSEPTVQLWH
jgi:hypothetical protein